MTQAEFDAELAGLNANPIEADPMNVSTLADLVSADMEPPT